LFEIGFFIVSKEKKEKKEKKRHTKSVKVQEDYPLVKGEVVTRCLSSVTEQYAIAYGSEVVEERAVPDYRDGLKPVHRAILWSMYDLGLKHTAKVKKSARTVGDVIGRFHPHGDTAAYGAMVTIANTRPNLVHGQGNWGDAISGAAAQRYTEARLSEFSDRFLLHPDYLAVTPMVPNFSNDAMMPLYLPCRVPLQMIMGSPLAPAFGVRCGTLPLQYKGVMQIVKRILNKEKMGSKHLLKYLKPNLEWGGEYVGTKQDLLEYFRTGKASLKFRPEMLVDEKQKTITIISTAPGYSNPAGVKKKNTQIKDLPGVTRVTDVSSSKSPGKYGFEVVIHTGRVNDEQFGDICDKVYSKLTTPSPYDIGYTKRGIEKTKFGRAAVVKFLEVWCNYLIKLEKQVLEARLVKQQGLQVKQENLLFAVDNRVIILKSLETKDPDAFLVKKLKISAELAKAVLDMQVRRLAKLERVEILAKINAIKKVIKALERNIKNPAKHILDNFDATYFDYMKKTKDKF
jgi:topoisomerase-4 subunit A